MRADMTYITSTCHYANCSDVYNRLGPSERNCSLNECMNCYSYFAMNECKNTIEFKMKYEKKEEKNSCKERLSHFNELTQHTTVIPL